MKALLRTFVAGAVVALTSVPSFAAVIYDQNPAFGVLGTYPSKTPTLNYGFSTTAGEFTATFSFDLSNPLKLTIGYNSSYSDPSQKVSPLTIDLYSFANGVNTRIDGNSAVDISGQSKVGNDLIDTLQAGSYSFIITGTAPVVAGIAGTVNYASVSAVPLPASAPMFGAALFGLAGLGYAAKRKKVGASAA